MSETKVERSAAVVRCKMSQLQYGEYGVIANEPGHRLESCNGLLVRRVGRSFVILNDELYSPEEFNDFSNGGGEHHTVERISEGDRVTFVAPKLGSFEDDDDCQ